MDSVPMRKRGFLTRKLRRRKAQWIKERRNRGLGKEIRGKEGSVSVRAHNRRRGILVMLEQEARIEVEGCCRESVQ